jgi:hypothetical protein
MPDLQPILADSSALIALCACNQEVSDLVFSEIGLTTTWTCYKEVHDKAENGESHSLREAASRLIEYVEDDVMEYPTRKVFPGSPNAGVYNAGEKSLRIALSQHEEFTTAILYDDEASIMLNRLRKELEGTANVFEIEAPNFPLFILSRRNSSEDSIDEDVFCNQTERIIEGMGWGKSENVDIFWKYPVQC